MLYYNTDPKIVKRHFEQGHQSSAIERNLLPMMKDQSSTTVKALQVLECFMDSNTEWTLKTIAAAVEMPSTSVYRQLSTLVAQQYLVQDSIRKSYRVGPRLLLLSGAIFGKSSLRQLAYPEMQALNTQVRETVNLIVLMGHEIFYLEKIESQQSISCRTHVGDRLPAYATSAGKILLAYQPQEMVEAYCHWMDVNATALTLQTLTTSDALRSELVQARLNGYAMDNSEIEEGLTCFGAPIFNMNGEAIAALSVAGPNYRMEAEQETLVKAVRAAAQNISRLLGWH